MGYLETVHCSKLIVALALGGIACGAQSQMVVAYVPNWNDLAAFAPTIDFAKITHINIAFENPTDDSGTMSFNEKEKPLIELAHSKGVKVLVSIGGGSVSEDATAQARYFGLLADANRARFVAQLADYVAAHNFDGLDVDLEGPAINKDYGAFVDDLSKALKAKGKLLTAAVSQGYGGDSVPASALAAFDFVNVMAYDGTGPWNADIAGQHSSMDLARSNITYWLGRGLPRAKAVLGVPFYGYGFGDAFRKYEYPFSEIVKTYPGSETMDQVGKTIWYNGIPTIQAKAKFVLDEKLGGMMIWSLDSDASGPKSLLAALYKALHP